MAQEDYPVIGDQNNLMTAPGPGAAMANNLQAILAQQRAAKQQDLINQLNQNKFGLEQQNVNSQIADRNENTATNRAIRESTIAKQAQETAGLKSKQEDDANVISGMAGWMADPNSGYSKMAPEHQQALQLIQATKNPELMRQVMRAIATAPKPDVRVPLRVFDEASGGFTTATDPITHQPILGGENERPIIRSRPPVAQTPTVQSTFQTPDGETLINMNKLDAQGKPIIMKLDGTRYTGPAVKPDNKNDVGIPPGELTKINGLRVGNPNHVPPIPSALPVTQAHTLMHPFDGETTPADPQALQAWRQAAIAAVANKKLPTHIMEAFTQIINNPDIEKFTSPEIAAFPSFADFSPKDKATLERYLTAVRGN